MIFGFQFHYILRTLIKLGNYVLMENFFRCSTKKRNFAVTNLDSYVKMIFFQLSPYNHSYRYFISPITKYHLSIEAFFCCHFDMWIYIWLL